MPTLYIELEVTLRYTQAPASESWGRKKVSRSKREDHCIPLRAERMDANAQKEESIFVGGELLPSKREDEESQKGLVSWQCGDKVSLSLLSFAEIKTINKSN